MVNNPTCNASYCDTSLIPGLGRSHVFGATKAGGGGTLLLRFHNKKSHCNEKPKNHNEEEPLLEETRESPLAATKTHHRQK